MNTEITNKVYLQGIVDSEPELDHSVKDEDFYKFNIKVARLSEQTDTIPVTISKRLVDFYDIKQGSKIALKGQFRSYNKMENDKRKLLLFVFVKEVCEWDDNANPNYIELDGYICKPVIYRKTPFAREICDVLLAVNRNFNKSDYIPCIAWGNNAKIISGLEVPARIKINGRIQSREYNKKVEGIEIPITKIAYEVSISKFNDVEKETLL